ncbi:hypothetical protein ACP70R_041211 [Stipagrostis hirtigluma subsp. patula]
MAKLSGATVVASLFLFFSGVLFAFLTGQAAAAPDDVVLEKTVFIKLVNESINGNSTAPGNPRVGPSLIRLLFHDCWEQATSYSLDGMCRTTLIRRDFNLRLTQEMLNFKVICKSWV